jgi:hypothetical protein
MMLVTNMHWHNHVAVATFSREPDRWESSSTKDRHRPAGVPDTQQIPNDCPNKLRRKPNELMPCTASRCHRYQLVERLEAFQVSIPDAVELTEISGVINDRAWP